MKNEFFHLSEKAHIRIHNKIRERTTMSNPHCKDVPQDMFEKHDYHHQWEKSEKPSAELEDLLPTRARQSVPLPHQSKKVEPNE